jgi:hypothetical protein
MINCIVDLYHVVPSRRSNQIPVGFNDVECLKMSKVLGALVGVALLGSVGVASAAEPVPLADNQMDRVSAGDFSFIKQRAKAVAVAVNYSPSVVDETDTIDGGAISSVSGFNAVAAAASAKNKAVVRQ